MVFVFLFLTYFSQDESSIHVAANGIIFFFFMAGQYSIVYIHHIFLIHSSVDGHFRLFPCLVYCEQCFSECKGEYTFFNKSFVWIDAEEWDYWIVQQFYIQFSEVRPLLFSMMVVPIYIPTNSAGGFPFLHTLSSICYLLTC